MSPLKKNALNVALALGVGFGLASCADPAPDPPIVATGDPAKANPVIVTTTTEAPPTTTTTLFFDN
jgi:hypothetical protein